MFDGIRLIERGFPVKRFSLSVWRDALFGTARFKGKYLYLNRDDLGKPSPICRPTWNGSMGNWDFAIYKYSSEKYDPDEWFFPGEEFVDGTVTGAMKAGMEAYQI